jgi:hypothetical protein
MAVKTSTPWWVSALLFLGLLLIFTGQRVLSHIDAAASGLTWLGLLLVLGSTGVRAWAMRREKGKRRAVERLLLLSHAGALLALLVYYLFGTASGQSMLGIETARSVSRTDTIATILWVILMGVSLVPLLMAELSLGFTGRDWFPKTGADVADEAAVELFRVREMATGGLTIALGAAFLMVTCNVAKERDVRKDVSYFKTSQPGSATVNIASSMDQPMTVLVFFPEPSQVADEVEAYFKRLAEETGKVVVERHDRTVSPGLAKDYKVSVDGTVVLVKGETPEEKAKREDENKKNPGTKDPKKIAKSALEKTMPANEKLTLPTEFGRARRDKLREFDAEVQKALMKVVRAKRVAYLSVGHGELNDPKSAAPGEVVDPQARTALFKQILGILNYEVKSWDGFGKPVPDDATILYVLGPRQPLLDEDLGAIDDYLDRGGAVFIALDPRRQADLGSLEGRLGVKFDRTPVADDKEFFIERRNAADHRTLVTNQFSSHASVTTLSRAGVNAGIPMVEAGSLHDADYMVEEGQAPPKRTYVIRSMSTAFLDKPSDGAPLGNFQFDKGDEKRERYNLAAAIEDPSRGAPKGTPAEKVEDDNPYDPAVEKAPGGRGMRAMVFADVDIFQDSALARFGGLQYVVRDATLWLGGEESLTGETANEKDVSIEHTKSEDVVWFYLSLVGAPLIILGAGLGGVVWRRRLAQRRRS